jgi:acyl-CoA thioesterase
MDINLNRIRNFFAKDRYAAHSGVVIDAVREDSVECSMEISEIHLNAGDMVQGGAIFTLADFAFAVHSNMELACGAKTGITVGQSCSISYLRSPKGKRLIATTERLSKGRSVSVYRITIRDDLGTAVAEMHGNGFTVRRC